MPVEFKVFPQLLTRELAEVTKGSVTPVGGVSLKQIRAFWFTLLELYAKSSPMRSRGASEAMSKAKGCF